MTKRSKRERTTLGGVDEKPPKRSPDKMGLKGAFLF